jgi:membrane fusion protein, multidrug efflux system
MATAVKLEEMEKVASPNTKQGTASGANISKKVLAIALAGVGVLGSLGYWLYARNYESTDDAQVDGHFAQLSTRITGTVTYVNPLVENDRFVTAGTLLLELDPRDYEATLEHAKATLETKAAELHAAPVAGTNYRRKCVQPTASCRGSQTGSNRECCRS